MGQHCFSPYITTNKLPNGTVGVAYSAKVEASHDLGANWFITGGQLPPGLQFDDSRISGIPTVGGTFNFEVTVETFTSNVDNNDSRRFTVLILDVTTQTLPDGNANQAYGPFTLGAVGLVGTPSWAVASGNLPGGISLTSAGVLAGTPASGGTFLFTVKVTDKDVPPRSKTRDLSLVVLNPVPMLALMSPSSAAGGDPSFNLMVNGSDFVPTSVVEWNAADRPTTFVRTTQLTAAIPASDISTGGTASVAVRNPSPQGGVSNSFAFDVTPASSSSFVPERVSVSTQGNQANGPSARPSVSADGRFIAFESSASNLVPVDSNRVRDIFLRDICRKAARRCIPSTVRISLANDGSEPNGASFGPSIGATADMWYSHRWQTISSAKTETQVRTFFCVTRASVRPANAGHPQRSCLWTTLASKPIRAAILPRSAAPGGSSPLFPQPTIWSLRTQILAKTFLSTIPVPALRSRAPHQHFARQ
jgi:hypothetical protein